MFSIRDIDNVLENITSPTYTESLKHDSNDTIRSCRDPVVK